MSALTMRPAVLSEVGWRENQEDAAFASPRLLAVADGVGGAAAGELASRLAILKMIALDKRRLIAPLEQELNDAVADANAVIAFASFHDPAREGMGTTLTAVALSNEREYLVANVGDSRTYLLRDGRLSRLTRDDSLVQELIDRGVLSEGEAYGHPQRSIVLEALDGIERPLSGARRFPAREGDRLLLCSDGISDYLTDHQIRELLMRKRAADAAHALVHGALERGSRDNLTAVIADVITTDELREGWLDALPPAGSLG